MSKVPQYNFYYSRNSVQKVQPSMNVNDQLSHQELQQTISSLKQKLQEKQSLIIELSEHIQHMERLLDQKQFLIQEKQLELQYIHKENEDLHQKLFQLNQKLNQQRAGIKETIKNQVSMLRQEFNFMIKENQTKNEIILEQKQKQFKRKQQELNSVIRDLSQRASSQNSSFYYEESHSNIIKSKNVPSNLNKRNEQYFEKQQEKNSTANSNLKNSRQSYKSTQLQNRILASLKGSQVDESSSKSFAEKQKGQYSFSNIMFTDPGQTSSFEVQNQSGTGRFGYAHKQPSMIKQNYIKSRQNRPQFNKSNSKANIQEIINRSKRQLFERNRKNSQSNLAKNSSKPALLSFGRNNRISENLNSSKDTGRYGIDISDQKSKFEKIRQISSLKMKVNMLKTQLQQQITFCQHKE